MRQKVQRKKKKTTNKTSTQIINYFENGEARFAIPVLCMILSSLLFQIFLVVGQNRKAPRRELILEVLYVLTFLKPAIDAYRIAMGAVKKEHQVLHPLQGELSRKTRNNFELLTKLARRRAELQQGD